MTIQIPTLPSWLQNNTLNPLFSDEQLVTYERMIAATLESCSVPCKLVFGDCRYVECIDCTGGVTRPGGGSVKGLVGCTKCNGSNQIAVDEELEICFAAEFSSAKFEKYSDIDLSKIDVQIMTHIEYCPLLKGMKYIYINTCDGCCDTNKYKVVGPPYPCGFGRRKPFIIISLENA